MSSGLAPPSLSSQSRVSASRYSVSPSSAPVQHGAISAGRVAFALILWVFGIATGGGDSLIVCLTGPVLLVVLIQLARIRSRLFTADDMVWLCVLVFFVVAPCQAVTRGVFASWITDIVYPWTDFARATLVVLVATVSFAVVRSQLDKATVGDRPRHRSAVLLGPLSMWALLAIAAASFAGYVQAFGGTGNVLAARNAKIASTELTGATVGFFCLGLLVAASTWLAALLRSFWHQKSALYASVCGAILLCALGMLGICANPFNLPRFVLLGAWLPVCLVLLGGLGRYWLVYTAALFGLLVLMPLMSLTTREGVTGLAELSQSDYSEDVFMIKDVDAFNTLVHSMKISDEEGYMAGKNTLAIVLFFVPRSYWPSKPIVGGLLIGGDIFKGMQTGGTDNLSYFVGGDLYLDYGFVGVALGFALLAAAWHSYGKYSPLVQGHDVASPILAGSVPILIRGPLGAVVGFFVCVVLGQVLLRMLLGRTAKKRLLQ